MEDNFNEVKYECSACGSTQVIRYFPHDAPLPVTCCVKCRAGFNLPLSEMIKGNLGMFPA